MATLDNARHERFCQARIQGKSIDESYVLAGFKANRGNAARLNANEVVLARLRELQAETATAAVVTATELSDQLEAIRVAAVAANQLGAAAQAVMGRAKLHGLIIDKAEVKDVTPPLEPSQRQAEIDRLLSKRPAHLRVVGG